MKNAWLALLLLAGTSQAAITISGAAVTGAHDTGGINVAAGVLALLIVDTTGDGFVGMGHLAMDTTLTSANDPGFAQGGATIGSLFCGDLVMNTMTTSASGAISGLLTNVSVADYLGMQFAVVWIYQTGRYGIVRGADWTFPAADSGTYTMSPIDNNGAGSYFQVTNNAAAGSYNFRTTANGNLAAVFGAPEPSAALLGALGALGLLRRRRSL